MTNLPFTSQELQQYNRHLIIPGFGTAGQARLKAARVLVMGCGGLGSPLLLYLAAAGVGTIGLVDFDTVDASNLQRQVLYSAAGIGELKVDAAARRLEALNPHITIVKHHLSLDVNNISPLIESYDVVADGTDNFPTRYLVNDACVLAGKPLVYGSVFQFEGQVAVFNRLNDAGERGPNYRDLHPVPPAPGVLQNCAEGGVLGVLPGIIGSLQALEVIKLITGLGEVLDGKLYLFDALEFEGRKFTVRKDPANVLNQSNVNLYALPGYDESCLPLPSLTVEAFSRLKEEGETYQLIDVREAHEYEAVNIGGELIPLGELPGKVDGIARTGLVIVHCKSGARSAQAVRRLQSEFGFNNVYTLAGGIDAYLAH